MSSNDNDPSYLKVEPYPANATEYIQRIYSIDQVKPGAHTLSYSHPMGENFFMISGEEALLHHFRDYSACHDGLFNMSLGAAGSVTYHRGQEYRVAAEKVEAIVDTTGCGDSYHAGLVCSYMLHGDITKAMQAGSRIAAVTLSHFGGF